MATRLVALGALLLLGATVAVAQEAPKAAPTGCEVYASHLKQQRDNLEAQLSNVVAELATLKKKLEPEKGK